MGNEQMKKQAFKSDDEDEIKIVSEIDDKMLGKKREKSNDMDIEKEIDKDNTNNENDIINEILRISNLKYSDYDESHNKLYNINDFYNNK
jgi:hypothetical protein